jgi:hypothetical protein
MVDSSEHGNEPSGPVKCQNYSVPKHRMLAGSERVIRNFQESIATAQVWRLLLRTVSHAVLAPYPYLPARYSTKEQGVFGLPATSGDLHSIAVHYLGNPPYSIKNTLTPTASRHPTVK